MRNVLGISDKSGSGISAGRFEKLLLPAKKLLLLEFVGRSPGIFSELLVWLPRTDPGLAARFRFTPLLDPINPKPRLLDLPSLLLRLVSLSLSLSSLSSSAGDMWRRFGV